MQAKVRPTVVIFALAAIIAAAAISRLGRRGGDADDVPTAPGSLPPRAVSERNDEAPKAPGESPAPTRGDGLRDRKIAELDSASISFRDTTLLLAVHASDFICEGVAEVMPVGEPPDKGWHLECLHGLAYAISVDASGALVAVPAPASVDGLPMVLPQPQPIPR